MCNNLICKKLKYIIRFCFSFHSLNCQFFGIIPLTLALSNAPKHRFDRVSTFKLNGWYTSSTIQVFFNTCTLNCMFESLEWLKIRHIHRKCLKFLIVSAPGVLSQLLTVPHEFWNECSLLLSFVIRENLIPKLKEVILIIFSGLVRYK